MTNLQLANGNAALEPTTRALSQLSPQSQETVIALVRQLAEREGDQRPSISGGATRQESWHLPY